MPRQMRVDDERRADGPEPQPEAPAPEPAREDPGREGASRGGGGRGINQVTLVGRLTRDPELRVTGDGVPRTWFVLAVPRPFTNRDGERDADFVSVVAWRQLATVVAEHLSKGRLAGVTGRLQVQNQEQGDGSWRTTAEVVADQIVFLDGPRKTAGE
ncbi:MAG TPA: single-stranded DNA-binding protein [bacterium]|nr:single-stranded DNA-binding protein [bacterium]